MGHQYANVPEVIVSARGSRVDREETLVGVLNAITRPIEAQSHDERLFLEIRTRVLDLALKRLKERDNHYLGFAYDRFGEPASAVKTISIYKWGGKDTRGIQFEPGLEYLGVMIPELDVDYEDSYVSETFLGVVREIVEVLHSEYAWGGIQKRDLASWSGRDPRTRIWAYNFLGPAMASRVSQGAVEGLKDEGWEFREGRNGGLHLTAPPNPFGLPLAKRARAEELLGLAGRSATLATRSPRKNGVHRRTPKKSRNE